MAESIGYCHMCRLVVRAPYLVAPDEDYFCHSCNLLVKMRPRTIEVYTVLVDCFQCGLQATVRTVGKPIQSGTCPKCGSRQFFEGVEKC